MNPSSTAAAWASAIAAIASVVVAVITAYIGYQVLGLDKKRDEFLSKRLTLSAIESHKTRMNNLPTAFNCGYALNEFPDHVFMTTTESKASQSSFECHSNWCQYYRACVASNIRDGSQIILTDTAARQIIVTVRKTLQSYELLTGPAALEILDNDLIHNDLKTDFHCKNPFLIYLMRHPFKTVKEQYPGIIHFMKALYPEQLTSWSEKEYNESEVTDAVELCQAPD